jgi:hypothetical protein
MDGTRKFDAISIYDLWNSKINDKLYAKDNYNNLYVFEFNSNKYILKNAYAINDNIINNIEYKKIENNFINGTIIKSEIKSSTTPF